MENEPDGSPHPEFFRDAAEGLGFVYLRYPSPTETAEYKLKRDLRLYNLERRVSRLERKSLESGG
jgi:hypothetical protein